MVDKKIIQRMMELRSKKAPVSAEAVVPGCMNNDPPLYGSCALGGYASSRVNRVSKAQQGTNEDPQHESLHVCGSTYAAVILGGDTRQVDGTYWTRPNIDPL